MIDWLTEYNSPNHLDIITDLLAKHVPKNTDLLMSFMTDGALLAVPVAIKLGLPVCIWRDYHYEMKDALTCSQVTGYYSRQLYCCKPHDGARICLLDAILSTGGTITAASKSLSEIATVVSVVVAAEKEKFGGRELVRNEVGVDPVAVFNVDIANEAIRVRFGSNLIEG